jgi:hypothetical protein
MTAWARHKPVSPFKGLLKFPSTCGFVHRIQALLLIYLVGLKPAALHACACHSDVAFVLHLFLLCLNPVWFDLTAALPLAGCHLLAIALHFVVARTDPLVYM